MSLLLLEDKQSVKFGGVARCELYMHYECIFHVLAQLECLIHILSQPYCTNPPFYNVLQNMMEIQAKEKLIEMKVEPKQGEKICRKRYLVCPGVGNPRLGIEMTRLGEPVINKKTHENSSLVHLGVGSYA